MINSLLHSEIIHSTAVMEKLQTPCLLLDMTSYTQLVFHKLRNGELL